jgi:hypothetical protein
VNETAAHSAAERLLDHAIELTFPASDPIAVHHAFDAARKAEPVRSNGPTGGSRRAARTPRRPAPAWRVNSAGRIKPTRRRPA